MRTRPRLAVFALLALAALLRVWSLDFALPVDKARPDEEFVSGIALRMIQTGDPNPHFFHYPTLLIYVNAAVLSIAKPLQGPKGARLLSRVVSALTGVLTVGLLVPLGSDLFSRRVGVLASVFLAVAYLHVRESHFGTTGVPMTFLVTLSVLLSVRGRTRWAALAAGLATSVKYPGVLAVVPMLAAARAKHTIREAAVALVIVGASVAVTSPFVLLDPEGARASLTEVSTELWGHAAPEGLHPEFPFTFALWYGIGPALLGLALAGLVVAAREPSGRILLAWVVPYYLAAAVTTFVFARYSLPFLPALCLSAAAFLERLPIASVARVAIVIVAVLLPIGRSAAFCRLLGEEDTREMASRFVRERVPSGEGILLMRGYGAPPIDPDHPVRLVAFRQGAVLAGEREGYRYLVTHEHPELQRFSRIDASLRGRLAEAERLSVFAPFREGGRPGVYDPFDAFYVPYADFKDVVRPGPEVTIWMLTQRGSE